MENFKQIFGAYFLILNLCSFITLGLDKNSAKTGGWRVSEKRLFILAFIGGAIGIYLGMKTFCHKTRHKLFSYGIPVLVLVNLLAAYFLTSLSNG